MKYLSLFLLLFSASACHRGVGESSLDPAAFDSKIKSTAGAVVLDVRTPGEFAEGHLTGAINVDYNDAAFQNNVASLDKSKPYFVYCLSGGRSGEAAAYMRSKGFKEVYELSGGILSWKKNDMPLDKEDAGGPPPPPSPGAPPAVPGTNMTMADYQGLAASETMVLFDFYAPWCGPCRQMSPIVDEISAAHPKGFKVVRINIDQNEQLASQLGITAIPVFKVFRDGKEKWSHIGSTEKETIEKQLR